MQVASSAAVSAVYQAPGQPICHNTLSYMAARSLYPPSTDSTGASVLATNIPHISPTSSLLASTISLPDAPLIAFSVYQPSSNPASPQALALLESARKTISRNTSSSPLLDSLLPSVHSSPTNPSLYVFAITSQRIQSDASLSLSSLHFDGLDLIQSSSFSPALLYPCSVACSAQPLPCPSCVHAASTIPTPPTPSSSSRPSSALLLPRQPLRLPFSQFIRAVRDHLLNDITNASTAPCASGSHSPASRLRDGFLLSPAPVISEWGSGWEHFSRQRPLVHCQLQIQLSHTSLPPSLVIHPHLRQTHYIPLRNTLPVPPGTPITLLPHGVPAYYLSSYAGPTSALNSQFEDALTGLGTGNWRVDTPPPKGCSAEFIPPYVIAWLAVQNKQGEDKGLPIVWPSSLCLAFTPGASSPHARAILKDIPELPAQLQSSPPAPAPFLPFGELSTNHDSQDSTSPMSTTSPSGPVLSQKSGTPVESGSLSSSFRRRPGANRARRPPNLSRPPVADSLMALKTLSLSVTSESIRSIAPEVSEYVDSIARDRERERERIKRERENGTRSHPSFTKPTLIAPQLPRPTHETRPSITVNAQVTAVSTQPKPSRSPVHHISKVETKPERDAFLTPASISEVPPSADQSSVEIPIKAEPPEVESSVPSVALPISDPISTSFADAFGGFDSEWVQSGNDFMDLDYDMNFNMNLDTIGGDAGNVGNPSTNFDIDDGFGVFTDDDFNVFDDGPVENKMASSPAVDHELSLPPGLAPTSGPPLLGISPPTLGDPLHISGPGPPSAGISHSSPWVAHHLGDIFTPHMDSIPPDLLPPSPAKTPSSYSAPATPSIQLSESRDTFISTRRRSSQFGLGPSEFDPIPFAVSHKIADGKYAVGKFSLPSPPDEEDRTEGFVLRPPLSSSYPRIATSNWNLVTNPSVAMVRKLVGAKRRRETQGGRPPNFSPRWSREYEEWEGPSVQAEEPKSESDDDEDDTWVEEEDNVPNAPRPMTPPPSYLPSGPTLLQTYFQHRHLLPLSVPLRTPGAVGNNPNNLPAPMSVPTPVSPAAILGAASEKTKSLEAAAQILVREVVENKVWADAWRANTSAASVSTRSPTDVRQFDTRVIMSLLKKVPSLNVPVDMKTLCEPAQDPIGAAPSPAQLMSPPMFTVGKSGTVMQVSPTALRFWDKLGLSPRSGKKDVTVFVFYEGSDEQEEDRIVTWLERLSSIYSAKHLGSHVAGSSSSCTRDGIVPIRFDSCRKTVTSFVATLLPTTDNLVFYVITPSPIISMTSPSLRQILSAIKKVLRTHVDTQILFQLVPEALIPATHDSTKDHTSLNDLAASVYDRVLHAVDRSTSRSLGSTKERVRAYFQGPAFTLSRPLPCKVKFLREAHAKTLDVVDRQVMLHIGYHVAPCGKWLLAASVDQRGETHDLKAWLVPDDSSESFVVSSVWGFAENLLTKASVEWRVTVTKLGVMGASELDAWISHLETIVVPSSLLPPMQVAVFSAECDNGWTFIPPDHLNNSAHPMPLHRNSKGSQGSVYADASSSTYALFPTTHIPLTPHHSREAFSDQPFIPEEDDHPPLPDGDIGILPHRTSILVHVPTDTDFTTISMLQLHMLYIHYTPDLASAASDEDILQDTTRNFYELSILTRARWKLKTKPILPFQLSALEVMHTALDREDTNLD